MGRVWCTLFLLLNIIVVIYTLIRSNLEYASPAWNNIMAAIKVFIYQLMHNRVALKEY